MSLLLRRNISDIWSIMPVRLTLGDLGAAGCGEPWFPLRVFLLLSHVFMYGDIFCSLLCFIFSHHIDNSTMMYKRSLFLNWDGHVHNARFAFRVFFWLFGVLFFVWVLFFGYYLVLCFCYGITTAFQDCVAGPYASTMVGFTDMPWRLL